MIFEVVINEDGSFAKEAWIVQAESMAEALKLAIKSCYKGWSVVRIEKSGASRVIG